MKNIIFISKQSEQDSVILALTHNGYTVRIATEYDGKIAKKCVIYWREDKKQNT